jgi:hypothetical protein
MTYLTYLRTFRALPRPSSTLSAMPFVRFRHISLSPEDCSTNLVQPPVRFGSYTGVMSS